MQKQTVSKLLFEVGDLVQYVSFYGDDNAGWISKGDFGIVLSVRNINNDHQVVKVRWFSDRSSIDMASDCLVKVKNPDSITDVELQHIKEKK
tara:strand:- start:301 stop:576 length:276 start_codon:yes stop_codon:yes gene_type:complete